MMYPLSVIFLCVQFALLVHIGSGESCVQNGELDFRPDTQDCSVFHRCVGITLYTFNCPLNTEFSAKYITCISVDSEHASCTSQVPVNPICQTTTDTLIPHPTKCSLYYNCRAPARIGRWDLNLQECDHPQVYNPTTRRCEHYSMVDCGARGMPLGLCEYMYTLCIGHCSRPCYVDTPSCRNKADGLHAHTYKTNSSYFMVCQDGRLVYNGRCTNLNGRVRLFDPETKNCLPATKK